MVFQILIRGDHGIKPSLFSRRDQFSICQSCPTHFRGSVHCVGMQRSTERDGGALIKKDSHAAKGSPRLSDANSNTASSCCLLTPGNHSRKSSTVAPSSRFSKRARTGMRVPRNTVVPPNTSGFCSTSPQLDQLFTREYYDSKAEHSNPIKQTFLFSPLRTSFVDQRLTRNPSSKINRSCDFASASASGGSGFRHLCSAASATLRASVPTGVCRGIQPF